jgi:hypothetical protein
MTAAQKGEVLFGSPVLAKLFVIEWAQLGNCRHVSVGQISVVGLH